MWRHAYYREVARTSEAKAEKDENGNPVLVVVRPSALPLPSGFSDAYDQPSYEEFINKGRQSGYSDDEIASELADDARVRAVLKAGYRPTEILDFLARLPSPSQSVTRDDLSWVPVPVRLKIHPLGTVVYFKRFEKGSETDPGILARLAYVRMTLPLIGGFIPGGAGVIIVAWVVDGFRNP